MICQEVREEGAVALLRRQPLPPELIAHMDGCPACRQEWDELSPLPLLLAATRDDSVPPAEPASRALLARLLSEVDHRQRRRRVGTWVSMAAAIAVGIPAGIYVVQSQALLPHRTQPNAQATDQIRTPMIQPAPSVFALGSARNQNTVVRVTVSEAANWGSQLSVHVDGMKPGSMCDLVVIDRTGHRETAGSWTVPAAPGSRTFTSTVKSAPAELTRVQILDTTDRTVIADVPLQAL